MDEKLFRNGELVYCILYSTTDSHRFLPCKARVLDYRPDMENNNYLISIENFLDSYKYTVDIFKNMSFKYSKKDRVSKNRFKDYDKYNKISDLCLELKTNPRYHIYVDQFQIFKNRSSMMESLEEIIEFYLFSGLRNIYELLSRTSYKGKYKITTVPEFLQKTRLFLGNPDEPEMAEIEEYILDRRAKYYKKGKPIERLEKAKKRNKNK